MFDRFDYVNFHAYDRPHYRVGGHRGGGHHSGRDFGHRR
jgi:hypothetical protein